MVRRNDPDQTMPRHSVFLSGWEYNRLLESDPTFPKQSCLPSEVLWNGAAQFYLFKHVYCTKEAFDTEQQAGDANEMATCRIYADLQSEGILVPFDLSSLPNDSPTRHDLQATHRSLKERQDQSSLRRFLVDGNIAELEAIKLELLGPVMKHLNCVQNVSPNSVTNWFRPRTQRGPAATPSASAIQALTAAARKAANTQLGATLCRAPGTAVARQLILKQRYIEKKVQRHLIPELFLGQLSMADYLQTQVPYVKDFKPVSDQLWRDWTGNRSRILRLRDLAERHLWNDLHNDWLPRLEEDPRFGHEFRGILSDAVTRARMGPLLDLSTRLVILGFGIAVAGAVTAAIGPTYGVPAGVAAGAKVKDSVDQKLKTSENLAIFFQRLRRARVGRG
jgi:hypothetical protein